MKEISLIRSALFVPGDQPARIDKAVASSADVVIIDLEDAVAPARKEEARKICAKKIKEHRAEKILIRINGLATEYIEADLKEAVATGPWGIVLPMVEKPEQIGKINWILDNIEDSITLSNGSITLIPLIETALGIENSYNILKEETTNNRLISAAFGSADFAVDMGLNLTVAGEETAYAKARLAIASRAANISPPLDSPFMIDINDIDALEAESRRALQLGYQGKLCIHPKQLDIINMVFSPSAEEVRRARKIIKAFEEAKEKGIAAITVDGQFVDLPVMERAKRILFAIQEKEEQN